MCDDNRPRTTREHTHSFLTRPRAKHPLANPPSHTFDKRPDRRAALGIDKLETTDVLRAQFVDRAHLRSSERLVGLSVQV